MLPCNIGNYLIKRQSERYIITQIILHMHDMTKAEIFPSGAYVTLYMQTAAIMKWEKTNGFYLNGFP